MAVILTAFMMMCASACTNSDKTEKPEKSESTASSTAETQSTASTVSMPDPVPVPEGGWTDETIKDVIYINGKNLELPCTEDDLGDGFEIEPNEEADKEIEKGRAGIYHLNYYGYFVGFVGKKESNKIYSLDFDAFDSPIEDYPDIPFSINGVTIGTPFSDVKEIMGEDFSDKGESGLISFRTEHFWIVMHNIDDKISTIKVFYH